MTLLVHRQIKKFRLANNLRQKDLATMLGVSVFWINKIEQGKGYPNANYIARLREIGLDIRPSVFSRLAQLITAASRSRKMAFLRGVQTTEHERLWIKEQLLKKGVRHIDVAWKAGLASSAVSDVLSGRIRSKRVQAAFAEVLGYGSFEELLNAYRQERGGHERTVYRLRYEY
jgi:transcriptional regulator with XRE-family HTH domain